MINFLIGAAFGLCVASYGVMGIATALEKSIDTAKNVKITMDNK